jgi:hypothetical protein
MLPLKTELPANRLGPTGDVPKIYCATCHQGSNKPLYGAPMLVNYPELVRPTVASTTEPGTAAPTAATPTSAEAAPTAATPTAAEAAPTAAAATAATPNTAAAVAPHAMTPAKAPGTPVTPPALTPTALTSAALTPTVQAVQKAAGAQPAAEKTTVRVTAVRTPATSE